MRQKEIFFKCANNILHCLYQYCVAIQMGKLPAFTVMAFFICLWPNQQLPAQAYWCGSIGQGYVSGEPQYADRFGNVYAQADVTAAPNPLQSPCPNTGDFDVHFLEKTVNGVTYSFTQAEMTTICEVFEDLSALIAAPSGRKALIEVSKNPLLSNNTAAVGSAYLPNMCGLGHSLVQRVLATQALFPNGTKHGYIEFNPSAQFYTGPSVPPSGTPANLLDLYSITLHEALHVLGFASQIGLTGASVDGFYSLWDLNLQNNSNEFMIANAPAQGNNCCLDYHLNIPAFLGLPDLIWGQNCGDLVFNVPQFPPVNADYGTNDQDAFLNTLSHLDDDCGDNYVMNFEFNDIFNNGIRRLLTPAEAAILCSLGYQTDNNCQPACLVMATDDGPFTRWNRLAPQGFPFTLSYDDLLNNDVVSPDAVLRFPAGCMDNNQFVIVNDPVARTITINFTGAITQGYFELCYALSGCGGRVCDRANIGLFVSDNPVGGPNALAYNCDAADCRLVCNGDFEAYFPSESYFHTQAGMPTWQDTDDFPRVYNSTLDMAYMPATGNQIVSGISDGGIEEAFTYPLRRPIPPNCSATFSFDCATYNGDDPWRILGFNELPPCTTIRTPNGCSSSVFNDPLCAGLSSVCIREIPANEVGNTMEFNTFEISFGMPGYPFPDNRGVVRGINAFPLTNVTFTWTNNSSIPINFIMIDYKTAGNSINYIDNLSVELAPTCLNHISITPSVEAACINGTAIIDFEICLNGPVPGSSDIQITVPVPSSLGLSYGSGGDFVNGNVTITGLTPGQCVTRRLVLNLPGSLFDGQVLDFEINALISGACWDNQGNNTFQATASNCCEIPFSADFSASIDCRTVTFTAAASPAALTHAWDFDGDQIIDSNVADPVYTYLSPGIYTVTHQVINACGRLLKQTQTIIITCINVDNFSCPCTASNTLNIDATVEHRYSVLESTYNYDKNDDGILDGSDHSGCIAIMGTLIIDENLKIRAAANVRMQPCSEIVVGAGNTGVFPTLELWRNNFSGCVSMWKGITVNPNCALVANRNSFADAEFAIHAVGSGSGSFPPPGSTIAKIGTNNFYRNHVGVLFDGLNSGLWPSVAHAPFVGNTFDGAGALLPSCTPSLTNYAADAGYVGVAALGIALELAPNTFRNLRNGAIGENTWMDITGCTFVNISGNGNISGLFPMLQPSYASSAGVGVLHRTGLASVTDCTFDGVDLAVYGNQNQIAVTSNEMPNVTDGVISVDAWGIDIENNPDISYRETGIEVVRPMANELGGALIAGNILTPLIPAFSGIAVYFGNNTQTQGASRIASNIFNIQESSKAILLSNSYNWLLDYNYAQAGSLPENALLETYQLENVSNSQLYGNGAEVFPEFGHLGTGYYTAMSPNNTFCCNYSLGFDNGMQFIGPCEGTALRHQDMWNQNTSIFCSQATVLGDQPDPNANPTGNHSNQFYEDPVGGTNAGGATHLGSDLQIGASQFFVKTAQSPDYPASISTPNNDPIAPEPWFIANGNPTTPCTSGCPPPDPWDNDPQTAAAYATGSFMNDPFGEVLTWEGQLNLFSRLKQDPDQMTGNSAMAAFYNASDTGAIGAFETVASAIRNLNTPPAEMLATWEQALAQVLETRNALENKKAALNNALTGSDSTSLFRHIDSIQQAALPALGQILDLQHNFKTLRQQRAAAALATANQLPENTLWQHNRKTIDRLYLETAGMGIDSLNTQQFSEVSAIAHQCPLEGGSAVYRARALYRMRESKTFSDDLLCTSAVERSQTGNVAAPFENLRIHPNPATETLLVDVPGKGQGTLAFFDLHGKTIHSIPFDEARQLFNIEVKTWAAGIYFCRVNGERGTPKSIKVIIQH